MWETLDLGTPCSDESKCVCFQDDKLSIHILITETSSCLPEVAQLTSHPHSHTPPILQAGEWIPLLGKPIQGKRTWRFCGKRDTHPYVISQTLLALSLYSKSHNLLNSVYTQSINFFFFLLFQCQIWMASQQSPNIWGKQTGTISKKQTGKYKIESRRTLQKTYSHR